MGENIADAGGLSIAFNAYQEMVKEKWPGQSEAVLPGPEFSNLTPEQLLFISYGISFCETDPRQPSGYYVRKNQLIKSYLFDTYHSFSLYLER